MPVLLWLAAAILLAVVVARVLSTGASRKAVLSHTQQEHEAMAHRR